MKKRYMRHTIWGLLSVWLCIMVSCQDDMLMRGKQSTDRVMFTVSGDSAVAALSRVATNRHFLGMAGKDSVFISLVEETNDTWLKSHDSDSRSASFTTSNLSSFSLTAFVEDGSEFMKNEEVKKVGDNWEYAPIKYWPQEQKVHFFGYAKMNSKGTLSEPTFNIDNNQYTGTFSYVLPVADDENNDAVNQPDLVFAITPSQHKEVVHLPFKHALSAILFKIAGKPEDIILSDVNIRLSSVSTEGECSLKYIDATTLNFTWSETNHNGTYKQGFKYTDTAPSYLNYDANESQTFMMIPQTLTDAKLGVAFSYNGVDYNLEKPLKDIHQQWEANKKYTYIISISETVEVEIRDEVKENGSLKENVQITNTGLSDAYIRAAIVGYWENEGGNVVDWWDPANADDGKFEKATNWGEYWIQDGDFYYYKYPVKVGDSPTIPLFKTYTLEKKNAPTGAKLKLNIVVQAVKYEKEKESVTSAWPTDAVSQLSGTFE